VKFVELLEQEFRQPVCGMFIDQRRSTGETSNDDQWKDCLQRNCNLLNPARSGTFHRSPFVRGDAIHRIWRKILYYGVLDLIFVQTATDGY